jgi:methylated-DNA-[protein]-cysteine S-methyltransferase
MNRQPKRRPNREAPPPPTGLRYTVMATPMGWVGIAGSERGLARTTLPQPSADSARHALGEAADTASGAEFFADLVARLQAYFSGEPVTFTDSLDLVAATPFQRQVWEVTWLIPRGETRSYQWVATQAGNPRAARGVGQALARNPLPIIIPCHRVIASSGRLGGFGGGLAMKQRLLDLESR